MKAISIWPAILFFSLLFLLFSLVLFPAFTEQIKEITGKEISSVDVLLCPSTSAVSNTINWFKQENVASVYIRTEIQKDIVFPFIYAILLSMLLCIVYLKWRIVVQWQWIILIPFIATVADLLENFLVVFMLQSPGNEYGNAALICSVANCIKYSSVFLCLGLLATGLLANLVKILFSSSK